MITNYMFMKKVNYMLSQLINDKKSLYFCILILLFDLVYLFLNDDKYFIFGSGYGLEKLLNLNHSMHPILDMNAFFLRAFSYLGNLVFFNFLFLMIYNIIFKISKSIKYEALFVYIMNILIIIVLIYIYIIMS